MPMYEYQCGQCGRRTEKRQKFSDAPLTECPYCGGPLKKLISAPAVQFKGGGWYADGYGSKKSTASNASESGAASAGSEGGSGSGSADAGKSTATASSDASPSSSTAASSTSASAASSGASSSASSSEK